MAEETKTDFADMINAGPLDDWAHTTGIRVLRATRDEVTAELTIAPQHRQPYGIVHGGVHAGIIETLASIGAAIDAGIENKRVVGLENHTSFIRAARSGTLSAKATPITRGRRSQVWEVTVRDEQERIIATGRVRLMVLEPDAEVVRGPQE